VIQKPKNIPLDPGVYQFKDKSGTVIYVGKAKNLKNRVTSYFSNNLLPKTAQMISLAESVSFIKVTSEFEALLLEANLIKKYNPKYNIALKDDKSPLYIGITKDKYPRIVSFRKPELKYYKFQIYFGPYVTGVSAKKVMKVVRRIFPYSTHLPTGKICIYRQLGLCDPCPSEIENESDLSKKTELRKRYLKNIRNVKNLLNGKLGQVGKDLESEIKEYSRQEKFEEAKELSDQLRSFQNIALANGYDIEEYLENPNFAEDLRDEETNHLKHILNKYYPKLEKLERIECFDIAHISGNFPTASMVTTINGEAENKFYRHFKMYNKKRNSDVDSMREVISRRIKHFEDWGIPDLIIIDGGKPQLSAVHELLEKENMPFIGLAKRLETIVLMIDGRFIEIRAEKPSLMLLQRIRDEAHRFARRLHHKQISKSLR
jgi:excinuclease ABC subunit C